jgi:hypothetical protein
MPWNERMIGSKVVCLTSKELHGGGIELAVDDLPTLKARSL